MKNNDKVEKLTVRMLYDLVNSLELEFDQILNLLLLINYSTRPPKNNNIEIKKTA